MLIINMFQTNISSPTPYGGCGKMCTKNNLKSTIQGIGFSTTTLHMLTL
jgi:hypothetical protein